jgi:hypothetical protein
MEAHFSREIEEESEESLFQESLSLKKKGHRNRGVSLTQISRSLDCVFEISTVILIG